MSIGISTASFYPLETVFRVQRFSLIVAEN